MYMDSKQLKEFLDCRWQELSLEIKLKAKEILLKGLSEFEINEIKLKYNQDPIGWITPLHLYWGKYIRNYLRQEGISDEVLPTKQWDDYYSQCIEFAIGLRGE
jgi:hypothetical protein